MSIISNDLSFLDNVSSSYLGTISETKKEDFNNDILVFRGEEDIELTKETTLNIRNNYEVNNNIYKKSKKEKQVSFFYNS